MMRFVKIATPGNNYFLMKFTNKKKLYNFFILLILSQLLIINKSQVHAALKTEIKNEVNKDKEVDFENLKSEKL